LNVLPQRCAWWQTQHPTTTLDGLTDHFRQQRMFGA
jgi:hypothetical protein